MSSSRWETLVGKTFSHYQILQHIGSGGMGEVYLAKDTKLDRTVALKVLPREVAADKERMRRFEQEAKAASVLDHPNVAHIYEIGELEDTKFIAMQYFEGETLHNLERRNPPSIKQAIDIAIQVGEALQEAHSKGIVHRDIKPANILINSRGQVKVVDFGLAKISRPSGSVPATEAGVILGTVQYLSPEQALGRSVDHRSDIFSLGIVLYEMLTGRLPYAGENSVETLAGILHASPDPPSQYNPRISRELDRIILKCLEKDQDKRYQSTQEVLHDLRNAQLSAETEPMKMDSASRRWVKMGLISEHKKSSHLTIWIFIFAILAIASAIYFFSKWQPRAIRSVAVLPFDNANKDPNSEYLTDGITEAVINSLSQISDMKVLARGTVFSYKGKQLDPRRVGKDLKVDVVVSGSIYQHNNDLIVQAELVNVADGSQMWGNQFNQKLTDVVAVQSEISKEISEQLRRKLTGAEEKQVTKHYTENPEAFQYYLKGRYFLNKRTPEGFQKAIENFQKAIDVDSHYAHAYAGLADCYTLLPSWALLAPKEGHPKAKEYARKALSMDSSLAEAHASLAHSLHNFDLDWPGAEQEYQTAIKLNPNYAPAHHWYAWLLSDVGQHSKAIAEMNKALDLDPFSLVMNADLAHMMYGARNYDRAIRQLQKVLDLDPNFTLTYQYLAFCYDAKNKRQEALDALKKAATLSPETVEIQAQLGWAYARNGRTSEANAILDKLLTQNDKFAVTAYDIAMIYNALGNKRETFEWLQNARNEHSYPVSSISIDSRVDNLRSDPDFQAMIRDMNYPKK